MDILPVNFKVLWFCGAWKERKNKNIILTFLHACYKYAVLILIYQFTIFEVIELIRTRNHIHELTETLFLAATLVTLCVKYANFLLRKRELSMVLNCLRMKMCQPRNSTEELIMEEHGRRAKWSTLSFLMISHATTVGFVITTILSLRKGEWILPITRSYVPYSISKLFPYLATYLQQIAVLFYAVMLNVSFDSLVYGFTIHACGQIELICRRLTDNFQASETLREELGTSGIEECIRHHVLVQTFVKKVGALFIWTVMILFFFSLIILCTSIFLISKTKLFSAEFLSLCLYLGGMLLQIFFYCWYGNELELKSKGIANAIFSSNWTIASIRERKILLLLMLISQNGLMLSYRGICTLSLKTFTWIFKTSYSAFNLLQQASN